MAFFFTSALSRGVSASSSAAGGGGELPLYTLGTPGAGEIGGPMTYAGAFIPADDSDDTPPMTMYAGKQVIFAGSQAGRMMMTGIYQDAIAEITIPTLSTSTNINSLNVATMNQAYRYADSIRSEHASAPRIMGGLVHDGAVILGGADAYDNFGNPRNYMVINNAANLAGSTQRGMYEITGGRHSVGWLTPIPAEFQAALGATHLCGHGGHLSILNTTTAGISMYAIDADDIIAASTTGQSVTATPLIDYSEPSPMGGPWGEGEIWNPLAICGGYFFVPGTRTVMAVGQTWYGPTYDPRPMNQQVLYKSPGVVDENGESDRYAGYFSYYINNYRNGYWLFDVDDLIAVKDGVMEIDEVLPYEWGFLDESPFCERDYGGGLFNGAFYDESTNRLYISVEGGAADRFVSTPVIVAYNLAGIS